MKNNLKNVNTKKKKQYVKIQKFNRKLSKTFNFSAIII